MPQVSVILTSYNHEKYLREAIDSVLSQTFEDFELIIWDDASSDDSFALINGYSDPRIKAFRNEANERPAYGINKAISEVAAGEYIAIHHSDDVWELNKLERQVALLDSSPGIGAVFTWAQIIDEWGVKTDGSWFDQENRTQWEWLKCIFEGQNPLNHPSALIRRQCYHDVGVYRDGLAQTGDAEMWSRLLQKFSIHVIQEKLTLHRLFSDKSNTSGDRVDTLIRTSNEWNVLRENFLSLLRFDEIVAVFPNLKRFENPAGFDGKFLLAMACLYECTQRNAWQLGIKWLFELLFDDVHRERLERLYSFTYADLIKLTAEFDVYFAFADRRVSELRSDIARLNSAVAERDWQISERDEHIRNMYASRSWRFTQPLRFLERLAREALRQRSSLKP